MTDENQNTETEELVEPAAEAEEQDSGEPADEIEDSGPTPRTVIDTDANEDGGTVDAILNLCHGSLTKAFIEEIQNAPMAWAKMGERDQTEVIERCKKRAGKHITKIANAILNRGHKSCEAFIDTVTHKDGCKAVLKTTDVEGGIEIARRQGDNVLVVFPDESDYIHEEGGNFPKAQKDQAEIFTSGDDGLVSDSEADDIAADDLEIDPLYEQAVDFVISENKPSVGDIQKELRVGYNRAARLLAMMEQKGVVSVDDDGKREAVGLGDDEQVDTETGEIVEVGEPESEQVEEPAAKVSNYDLVVTGSIEATVNAKDIDDAVHLMGYTEYDVFNKGEYEEFAIIRDDERIEDDNATVQVHFSRDQTDPAE